MQTSELSRPAPFRRAFAKVLPEQFPQPLFDALMKLLQVEKTDFLYQELHHGPAETFCERLLAALGVHMELGEPDRKRIPLSGPVLALANHPFGIVEGVALARLLPRIRPDVKILANSLLTGFPELAGRIICVDPFGGPAAKRSNARGMREAIEWLEQGGFLLVFPSGEVSQLQFQFPRLEVSDPAWSPSIARLLRRTGAAALPLFISGRNSALFQLAGLLHPRLRTALLPRELLNKQQRCIELRCGAPVSPQRIARFAEDRSLIDYLRWRTYILAKRGRPGAPLPIASGRPLASPVNPAALLAEMPSEPLLDSGSFQVFVARGQDIPNTLREIGRLREQSFRLAGEGTGNPLDLDRFDSYYHHLYLWNRDKQEIAGAYRLGLVDSILPQHGIDGLYTSTLFSYHRSFLDRLGPAIELGRSFIAPSYQRAFQPLLLLWQGIGAFVLRHAPAHVLFGPVSISSDYSPLSRSLMVRVLSRHNGNPELSRLVRPRRPLRPGWNPVPPPQCDSDELADLVTGLEADSKSIPVLLRQYLKLGGRIVAFNVDSKFGNCLDGLIVVDLAGANPRLLERYMGPSGAARFLDQNRERSLRLCRPLHPPV
jgi:putative hemolysin